MRQINWGSPLSEEDMTWLRQSGILYANGGLPLEHAIRLNQGQAIPANDEDNELEDQDDDYDEWSKEDLEAEVENRRELGDIRVTGTGKNGNVLKGDLIQALRSWDQENGDTES